MERREIREKQPFKQILSVKLKITPNLHLIETQLQQIHYFSLLKTAFFSSKG